jgi:uncharacterized cupin superfamily protein
MKVTEIFADDQGETHFRAVEIDFETRAFAPPSLPVKVSAEIPSTTSLFMIAPPGWDEEYHATPRKQFCIMLQGELRVEATDGQSIEMGPGDVLLVNDAESKGHLSTIQGSQNAEFMFVGVDGAFPTSE